MHFGAGRANLIITAQVTPARRVLHGSYVVGLMDRALAAGGVRRSLTHVHWDASASCETPQVIEFEGRWNPGDRLSVKREGHKVIHHRKVWVDRGVRHEVTPLQTPPPVCLTMEVRCRRCSTCLRARASVWRQRCRQEIGAAERTWFGTLTLRSEEQFRLAMQAEGRVERGGSRWEELSDSERFRARAAEASRELTLWLKRIRKESEATLRYCLVVEAHKSGDPHWHCLVHEVPGGGSVKERTLRQQWKLGFSKFTLIEDEGAAGYVAKYLSKSVLARVRASIDYGGK